MTKLTKDSLENNLSKKWLKMVDATGSKYRRVRIGNQINMIFSFSICQYGFYAEEKNKNVCKMMIFYLGFDGHYKINMHYCSL